MATSLFNLLRCVLRTNLAVRSRALPAVVLLFGCGSAQRSAEDRRTELVDSLRRLPRTESIYANQKLIACYFDPAMQLARMSSSERLRVLAAFVAARPPKEGEDEDYKSRVRTALLLERIPYDAPSSLPIDETRKLKRGWILATTACKMAGTPDQVTIGWPLIVGQDGLPSGVAASTVPVCWYYSGGMLMGILEENFSFRPSLAERIGRIVQEDCKRTEN